MKRTRTWVYDERGNVSGYVDLPVQLNAPRRAARRPSAAPGAAGGGCIAILFWLVVGMVVLSCLFGH